MRRSAIAFAASPASPFALPISALGYALSLLMALPGAHAERATFRLRAIAAHARYFAIYRRRRHALACRRLPIRHYADYDTPNTADALMHATPRRRRAPSRHFVAIFIIPRHARQLSPRFAGDAAH